MDVRTRAYYVHGTALWLASVGHNGFGIQVGWICIEGYAWRWTLLVFDNVSSREEALTGT